MKQLVACMGMMLMTAHSMAAWELNSSQAVQANANVVVNILKNPSPEGGTSGTLWIKGSHSPEVMVPATLPYKSGQVFVPVFTRGEGRGWFTVLDSADNSSSTIYLDSQAEQGTGQSRPWLPHLKLYGEDNLPVLLANQLTTAVLELTNGTDKMPPTTHISAVDSRGRMVVSRFYNTFELVAGSETFAIPSAGEYLLTVRLLEEESDQFPRARYRTPIPISFGETTSRFEVDELPDGVTTHSVVGARVALEHLPTTATVHSVDRMRVVVLGRHSNEMQKNRWPYVIAGADLLEMSRDERLRQGQALLRWQRRLGSSFAPVHFEWPKLQQSARSFRFGGIGETLNIYRRHMVRPVTSLFGRAAWNNEFPAQTTETLSAWQRCVELLGGNYTHLMWAFYCWDGPEKTMENPAEYNSLVMATADGLQKKNGEWRKASPLLLGPTDGFDADYTRAVLTSETLPRVAGVSFDLFPSDPAASPEANGFQEDLKAAADLVRELKQTTMSIWIAGTGWPAGPEGVSPKLQANYLVRTHVMALGHGADKVTWNNLVDKTGAQARNNRWRVKGETGLLDDRMMPRLSGVAYNVMTYALSGATSPSITRQGDATVYAFNLVLQSNKWPSTLYVAWTDSPEKSQTVQLDMKRGGGVYAFDYLGAEVPMEKRPDDTADPISGTYTLSVGYEPVFIWDAGKSLRNSR